MEKRIKKQFGISLFLTFGFIAGVPLTVIGGCNLSSGWYFILMMVIGIIGIVAGFYVAPLAWIRCGIIKKQNSIVNSIMKDGIRSINVLCNIHGMKNKEMFETVSKLIQKRYITDLVFNEKGTELVLNEGYLNLEEEKQRKNLSTSLLCPSCGAQVSFNGLQGKCPYCGTIVGKNSD